MTNVWTLAKRELNAYFASPIAYIVLAMFAVGRPGDPDDLPQSAKEQEEPSGRKPARELIC